MNALQYVKNVISTSGKQLVFDTVGEYLPGTTALAKDSADLAKDLYTNVKDFVVNPMDNRIVKEYADIGRDFTRDFKNNLFEDLKTGKWYNEQRENDAAMDSLNEMFGGGFGDDVWGSLDDDDFGDWEFDDDEGGESSSTLAEMSSDKANTAAMIKNEQLVGERVANTVASATVHSADYIVQSNAKSSKALFSLNKTGFSQINTGMAAINANISNLVALGEPLTTHIQNSAAFFASTSEYQNKVLERLEAIQGSLVLPERSSGKRGKTISDFIMDNTLDIKGYIEHVGTNIKSMTSLFLGGDSSAMVKTMINSIKTSPMHFLISNALKMAIPEAIKNSAKFFEEAMGHFWTGALDKMRNMDFGDTPLGLVWDFIKGTFAPESGHKNKIDTSKYNRAAMHWDGEAKQALTYVIPRQLGEIISLLGGTGQTYDYKTGKFVQNSKIKKNWKTESYNDSVRAGGDYFSNARRAINSAAKANGYSDKDIKHIQDQLDLYNDYIFNTPNDETSYRVNRKNYKNSRMYDKIKKNKKFNKADFQAALEFLDMYNEALNNSHEGRNLRNSYRTSIIQGRESRGRKLDMYSEEGSIYSTLFDDFKGSSIKRDKRKKSKNISANGSSSFSTKASQLIGYDKDGNDIWYYLRGIYLSTGFVRENFGLLTQYVVDENGNSVQLTDVKIEKNNRQESETKNKKKNKGKKNRPLNTTPRVEGADRDAINEYVNSNITRSDKNLEGLSREILDYAAVKEAYESNMKEGDTPFEETPDYNAEYERVIKAHGGVKKLRKSIKGKIMQNQSVNNFLTKMNKYLKMPEEIMDKISAGAEASTMRALYGKGSNPNKGLFQVIQEGFTTLFGKLGSFLDEIFPPFLTDGVKTLWRLLFGENIGDKEGTHEGGLFSGLFNATKGAFRNAGNWFLGGNANEIPDMGEIAASGSGLLGISGGASRRQKKKNAKKGGIKEFAKAKAAQIAKDKVIEAKDKVQSGAENLINEAKESANSGGLRKAMDFLGESVGQLAVGVKAVVDAVVPDSVKGKSIGDEEKKKIASGVETLGKEMGLHKGNMGMGAVIGAGASLLTGAIIGPVAGAAIGAGVGLIASSEKVQNMLFGTKDERDKDPDKFMHKVGNWIDKNKKSIGVSAKGAALGAAAGAFMGSPVIGAVLGGAVGFASSSESAQKWLFGDENTEGKIPKEVQQMIKDRLPGIGAGALAGLMFGPLPSLPANIILGSALGFAAKSNKVQDWLFGEKDEKDGKRKGGALGWLKENIGNPIVGIFDKLATGIKTHIRNIGDDLKKMTRAFITKLLAGFVRGPLKALANSRVGQAVIGGAKGLASAPFKFASWGLNRINTGLEKSALKKGYSIKSRELGRNLNMEERLALRDQDFVSKNSKMASMEGYINNLSGFKDLDAFDEELGSLLDPSGKYTDEANKMRGGVRSALVGIGGKNDNALKELQKVYKYADSGNLTKAMRTLEGLVSSGIITEDQYSSVADKVKELADKRSQAKGAKANRAGAAKDILGRSKYANALTHKLGIDKLSDAQIRNLRDLVKDEKAFREMEVGKTKAAQEEEAGSPVTTNNLLTGITTMLNDIHDAVVYGKKKKRKKGAATGTGGSSAEGEAEGSTSEDGPHEGDTKVDEEGRKWIYTNNEWVLNTSDSETKDIVDKENEEHDAIVNIAKHTSILGTLGSLLGGIKDKLFGTKEKKKGIFSQLFDFLTGKATGVLSFLGNFFGGAANVAGQFLVKTLGNGAGLITPTSLIANVLGPALLIGGFKGWFDKILSKIGLSGYDGTPEDGNDRNDYTRDPITGKLKATKKTKKTTPSGEEVTVTEDAETGELVDPNSIRSLKSDKDSFSTKLWKNTARGILTGTPSVASKILGNTNLGKAIGRAVASRGGGVAGVVQLVVDQIDDIIPRICGALKHVPILRNFGDKIDDFGLAIMEKVTEKAPAAAAKLGKFVGDFVLFAKIAFVVIDFTTGYEDASTTLKVKEPTTGDRVLCGIIRVLKNCIPVIGSIIPDDLLIDLFVKYIGPAFGMEDGDLMQRREEYQAEIDQYNEEHGTNLTVAQYNKQIRKDFTWTERIGNHWNSAVAQTKEAYNQAKLNGKSGIEALGTAAVQFGKGLLADYPQVIKNMIQDALAGDIAKLWSETSEYFRKDENDPNQAEVGLFSTIVGQLPLITTKMPLTLVAVLAKGGHWLMNQLKKPIEAVKNHYAYIDKSNEEILKLARAGDPKGVSAYEVEEDPDNPVGGFTKGIISINKFVYGGVAHLYKFGKDVGEAFNKFTNSVKNNISAMSNADLDLLKLAKTGDPKAVSAYEVEEDPDNPISGFSKGYIGIEKFLYTGVAHIYKIGKDIGEGFKNFITSAVKSYLTFENVKNVLWEQAKTGDPEKVLKTDFQDEEGNPIGGIMGGMIFIEKLEYVIPALFFKLGNWIKEKISGPINAVKKHYSTLSNVMPTLWDMSKQGKPEDIMTYELEEDPENPVANITKAGLFVNKLTFAGIGYLVKGGKWIGEKVSGMVSAVKRHYSTIDTVQDTLWGLSKEGKPEDIMSYELEDDPENPIGNVTKAGIFVNKLIYAGIGYIVKGGKWIGEQFTNMVEAVKRHYATVDTVNDTLWGLSKEGKPEDIMSYELEEDPDNPVGKITQGAIFVNKLTFAGVGYIVKAGKWIGDRFNDVVNGVVTYEKKRKKINSELWDVAKEGDIKKLWDTTVDDDEGNPLGGVYKGVMFGNKLLFSIPSLVYGMGNGISNIIKDLGKSTTDAASNYNKGVEKLDQIYESSTGFDRIKRIFNEKDPNEKNNTGMGAVYRFAFTVKKTTMSIGSIFGGIFDGIKDNWNKFKDTLGNAWDTFKGWFTGGDKATVSEKGYSIEQSGSGSGLAAGSSFVSQRDPRYRNMNMAGNNVGLLGCGPATATMAANDLGKRGNMGSAVALASRYQTANGTDAAYFADYAARNGMKATYYVAGASMVDGIRAGHPTVLMGQDPYNTSKANSPFGPNNHYVVAKGMDGHGNIIVQDPELQGTRKYSPAILNSVKMGVGLSGGASVGPTAGWNNIGYTDTATSSSSSNTKFTSQTTKKSGKYEQAGYQGSVSLREQDAKNKQGNVAKAPKNSYNLDTSALAKQAKAIASGGNVPSDAIEATDNPSKVWAILRSKGLSEAATAGVLGNMMAESGVDPTKKQYGGGPGRGLCQWEENNGSSTRFTYLKAFAASRGRDWTDLETQVEYLWKELTDPSQDGYVGPAYWKASASGMKKAGAEGTTFEQWSKSTDVPMATRQFEGAFERGGKLAMDKRIGYAVEFYNRFTGKNIVYTGGDGVVYSADGSEYGSGSANTKDSGGTTGSSEEKSYGILDIPNIFSDVFNESIEKLFGGKRTGSSGTSHGGTSGKDSEENQYLGSITPGEGSVLSTSGGYIKAGVANDFPYYNQADQPWGPMAYGKSGTVKSSGCGPTSMAMVLKSYGTNVTPQDTASWSVNNGYRVEGKGTGWGFFNAIGKQSGLDTVQFSDIETAKQNLRNNIPVIASMRPGDFTKGGHFLVLSGLKNNEEAVTVNDPGSRDRTKKLWNTNSALGQAKQFWAISKNGKGSLGTYKEAESSTSKDGKTHTVTKDGQTVTMSAMGSGLPLIGLSGGDSGLDIHQIGTNEISNSPAVNQANIAVDNAISNNSNNKATLLMIKAMLEMVSTVAKNTNNIDKIYEVLVAIANDQTSEGGINDDEVTRKLLNSVNLRGNNNSEDTFSVLKEKVDQMLNMMA